MSKIICAAIKFTPRFIPDDIKKDIILPCPRHGDGYRNFARISNMLTGNYKPFDWDKEEGFIDEAGNFYTREKAFELVKDSLPASLIYFKEQRKETELYSEDLY
jgi:hypothetical protein|uniref:Uncharacterized protein n=1 Tax=Bacteriophage sp. TaxID=38018 RepID=A0A8D9PER2_9VIRU|nr:MAG TPA: hypothetical protein [Bacteriophage sp.]